MFKYISIGAALFILAAASPAYAQQPEVLLRKMEVPGADFDFVVVMAKSMPNETAKASGATYPLVANPIGDALAMAVPGEVEAMFKSVGSSKFPIYAFEVGAKGGSPSKSVAVYVVPKGEASASPMR